MENLTVTIKNNLKVILTGLAIILVGILIYMQYNTLVDLQAEVEEEQLALDSAQDLLSRRLDHQERAGEYEKRLEYAESKIPPTAKEDELLNYIQRLARAHDLQAQNISFGAHQTDEDEDYVTIPLDLTLQGEYSGLRQMLKDLHGGERAIRIDDLNISRAGGNGTSLQINISANTFYNP